MGRARVKQRGWSSGWETTARPVHRLQVIGEHGGNRRSRAAIEPSVGWNAPDHESLAGFRSGRRRG
jgi:hypothetical protein